MRTRVPGPGAAEAGAVIDVLHGLSMLPLVLLAPRSATSGLH
jgi:hypothetical protein